MTEQKKEVAQVETQVMLSPVERIIQAVGNADLDKVEKLMQLQFIHEANEAKKFYNQSMSVVNQNMGTVIKTLKNDQTHSTYAGLDAVVNVAKPVYANQGFSVSFYEGDNAPEGHVRVMMDLTHSSGHKETYHYDMPLDGTGIKGNVNMTKIHGKSSAVSYGRRYLLCMVFNLATGDDDDGNTAGEAVVLIDEKQHSQLQDLIDNTETNVNKFLAYFKVQAVQSLPKSRFNEALSILQKKAVKS